jgi:hypothetical protein
MAKIFHLADDNEIEELLLNKDSIHQNVVLVE